MARRNRDPEHEAKREKMSSLLQELKVSSMEDIHDLFKEMTGTFLENGLEGELDEELGIPGMSDYEAWTETMQEYCITPYPPEIPKAEKESEMKKMTKEKKG